MMTARHMADQRIFSHVLILALAIGAATGWGMWFLSGQRSDRIERELRQQVSTLARSQMQMLHERETAEAAKSDLASLQSQTAALRKEIEELTQRRDSVQAGAAGQSAAGNTSPTVEQTSIAETGSTTSHQPDQALVSTAQKALTKLGYGLLAADGIIGPSTRQAIEAFQYKNGIPVTRELDAATLQRLGGLNSVAAAE
ncbi:peptidoglycan-binding protein [Microvirga sp. TS319]|uniref:peptidoglycan-binding domain-containing protein n=1 Tax=Microvirga sp. TS319 TaxID=3241165 RepID=UPI00351A75A0